MGRARRGEDTIRRHTHSDMQRLPHGDLLGLKLVGSGGFGSVYRGRSKKLGMEIAVKILDRHSCFSAEFDNLMKEKDMMMKANSTYVLRVLAVYEIKDKEYGLVMEYMPHGSLHSLFKKFNEKKDLVPWALRFQILHQVALAMNFLHGLDPAIIHRDLKPQNVLLGKDLDVQLTDFGLARNETSVSTNKAGTHPYMPPESFAFLGYKPTKEFDVYSFGILIWTVLSGQVPYNGMTMSELFCRHIPNGQRPDMELVNCFKTMKMVPEAIEMMERCWDGKPSSRPCFAECMERLEGMKEAYDGEINDAVLEVLSKLRAYSSSVQNNQVADTPDGVNISDRDDSDLNTFNLEKYEKELNQHSPSAKDNTTADTNTSSEEIVNEDAERFLKRNFSKIIELKPDWMHILDDLFTQDIFQGYQVDTVKSYSMVQDQIRETLIMIMKQGQRSCRTLVQLMSRHHPSLMRKLAI